MSRTRSAVGRLALGIASSGLVCFAAMSNHAATAGEFQALGPKVVVYPGDSIQDGFLVETPSSSQVLGYRSAGEGRALLIGKRARKTLIPGQAIALADVENPRSIVNGTTVQIIYRGAGFAIVASGMALQNGSTGDLVRVRNADSGVTVSGVAQPDGTIVIGGG